jgi:LysM repeat protein
MPLVFQKRRVGSMKKTSWGITLAAMLVLLAAQFGFTTPAAAAPAAYPVVHIVRWGETLTGIAARYGTTVYAIATFNGIANPNRIYAGQRLTIPDGTWPTYGGFWYTVQYGDTLSGLAWRFGRSMWSIANANGLSNPNWIYAGQQLYIP